MEGRGGFKGHKGGSEAEGECSAKVFLSSPVCQESERSVLTPSFWGIDSRLTDGFHFYFCCCSIRKSGRLKRFCLKGTSSNGGVRQ